MAAAAVGVKHHWGWPQRPATPIATRRASTNKSLIVRFRYRSLEMHLTMGQLVGCNLPILLFRRECPQDVVAGLEFIDGEAAVGVVAVDGIDPVFAVAALVGVPIDFGQQGRLA